MKKSFYLLLIFCFSFSFAQEVAVLKYNGGGDWYANPSSLPNLVKFCNQNINTKINTKVNSIEASSSTLFDYPFIHMTGHGNVVFSPSEIENLHNYLLSGGFLHIDDNYGMDEYIRKEIKKIFPNEVLQEIPSNHNIFKAPYNFPNGLPKIHEHENKKPQAFGILVEDRLVLLYTFESDLGDGWEDEEVHNDPLSVREKALKMGANILFYAFNN
jgi:hypothetical protein